MGSLELEGHWNKTGVTPEKCKEELHMERTAKSAGEEGFHWNKLHLAGAKYLWGVELVVNHFGKEPRVLLPGKQRRPGMHTQVQEAEGGVTSRQHGPWRT